MSAYSYHHRGPFTSPLSGASNTSSLHNTARLNPNSMPVVQGIELVSIHKLPDRLRPVFPYPLFNAMQSQCFETLYNTDENLVVSAPTASGKTALLELAVCRLVAQNDVVNTKIVYIAPTKALCEERHKDWTSRFQHLGMTCSMVTGDSNTDSQDVLKRSQLIITTPEKWDSITRKWHDQDRLMELVRLLLIDEVHILNSGRGATVEAVVSRMKITKKHVRFIALSATVPNAHDVAAWLGRSYMNYDTPARREVFGEEFRQLPLQKVVRKIPTTADANPWAADTRSDTILPELIREFSSGKPVLIFCSTRKSCEIRAKKLAEYWQHNKVNLPWPGSNGTIQLQNKSLQNLAVAGVAFHHAGIDSEDRKNMEAAYLGGRLSIICCTSTLAIGVNLPCHLVLINNTLTYENRGGLIEYSDLDIMQMLGRAGRPQFDTHGIGIILTTADKAEKYERLAQGQELLESHLHENLMEHLNAEIALGTVKSMANVKAWVASTFFYVRFKQNRAHYQLEDVSAFGRNHRNITQKEKKNTGGFGEMKDSGGNLEAASVEEAIDAICTLKIEALREGGVVEPRSIKPTKFGELMAKQYVRFETMIVFKSTKTGASISDILSILCRAQEFHKVKLRQGETALYKALGKAQGIRFQVSIDSKDSEKDEKKRSIIIQSELGNVRLPSGPDFDRSAAQFRQDTISLFSNVLRLIRCFVDCRCLLEDGVSVKHGLELSRSLAARGWEGTVFILKQLTGIGPVKVQNLQQLGIRTLNDLQDTAPQILDRCCRTPLFGAKLLHEAKKFPVLRITVKVLTQTFVNGFPVAHCQADIGFLNEAVPRLFNQRKVCVHLLVLRSDGRLIDLKPINDMRSPHKFSVSFEAYGQSVSCYVACDEIAGTLQGAILKPDIPASRFPPAQITTTPIRTTTVPPRIDREAESEPRRLSNGNYECNHNCKDKQTCKHGPCCREGIFRPIRKKNAAVNSAIVNPKAPKQSAAHVVRKPQQTTTRATRDESEDFGGSWLDNLSILEDEMLPQPLRASTAALQTLAPLNHPESNHPLKRTRSRILDFSSETELDLGPKRPRVDEISASDLFQLGKVSQPGKTITGLESQPLFASEPQLIRSTTSHNIDEQIKHASQELARCTPFANKDGIDLDFMAEFEGCCEFRE